MCERHYQHLHGLTSEHVAVFFRIITDTARMPAWLHEELRNDFTRCPNQTSRIRSLPTPLVTQFYIDKNQLVGSCTWTYPHYRRSVASFSSRNEPGRHLEMAAFPFVEVCTPFVQFSFRNLHVSIASGIFSPSNLVWGYWRTLTSLYLSYLECLRVLTLLGSSPYTATSRILRNCNPGGYAHPTSYSFIFSLSPLRHSTFRDLP